MIPDVWLIGGVCALLLVAYGLSRVFERVWDWQERTSTKPDYHKIAFLERQLGYEVSVEDELWFDGAPVHPVYGPLRRSALPRVEPPTRDPVNPSSGAYGFWQVPPSRESWQERRIRLIKAEVARQERIEQAEDLAVRSGGLRHI
jgi:hypothetical protein